MRIDFRDGDPKRIVLLKNERDALDKVADMVGGLAMFWPTRFESLLNELTNLRLNIEADGELKGVNDVDTGKTDDERSDIDYS